MWCSFKKTVHNLNTFFSKYIYPKKNEHNYPILFLIFALSGCMVAFVGNLLLIIEYILFHQEENIILS